MDTITALPLVADDAATVRGYSDHQAATIIERTATRITVRTDTATLLNGPDSGEPDALTFTPGGFCGHTSGVQRWEHTPDPDGVIYMYTLRKNGRWVLLGAPANGRQLLVGKRAHHYDYNF